MVSKAKLKALSAYKVLKNREKEGVFIVEGVKMIEELLQSNFQLIEICATKDWINQHSQIACPVSVLSEAELERISLLQTPNQVWALVKKKGKVNLPEPLYSSLQIILDDIQDPGNMGTLIRTADWFGFKHIFCSEQSVSIYNPKVVQATMGSVFRVELFTVSIEDLLKAKPSDVPVYGALLEGSNIYNEPLSKKGLIIIGNESKGISENIKSYITHPLTIPRFDSHAESLNASVAAGIICSEFKRRQ